MEQEGVIEQAAGRAGEPKTPGLPRRKLRKIGGRKNLSIKRKFSLQREDLMKYPVTVAGKL